VVLKPKWFPSSSTCELLNHIPSEPNVQAARVPDHYAGYLVKAISRRKKEIKCVPRYRKPPCGQMWKQLRGGWSGKQLMVPESMDCIRSLSSIASLWGPTKHRREAL
jgi:hypothetical protein